MILFKHIQSNKRVAYIMKKYIEMVNIVLRITVTSAEMRGVRDRKL